MTAPRWIPIVVATACLAAAIAGCGGSRAAARSTKGPATAAPALPPVAGAPPAATAPEPPARALPRTTRDVIVKITGGKIELNGVAISATPKVADVIAILGKPDRVWDQGGANKIHTWDTLGVLVYEPYDGRCISATFPYKPMGQSFNPATMFGGSISLDGRPLTSKTALPSVKQWPGATTPYSSASVVFDRGDLHVFTLDERKPSGRIDLVELSFWQRGPRRAPPDDGDDDDDDDRPAAPDRVGALALECRAGDARMCTRLALVYQTGHGVAKDPAAALAMAKLGCDGGDAFACTMAGNMYEAGRGASKSHADAVTAWKRACKLGDAVGCARAR